jgi:hypothetical protein
MPNFNMTDQMEQSLRTHFFRTATYSKPNSIVIALSSGIPGETATGTSSTFWELGNVGAYARQTLAALDANWSADSTTAGLTYNNSAITFPQATADWGWVSGVLIVDTATYNVGSGLMYGSLTTPKLIQNGDQFIVPISGLSIQFD